MKPFCLLISVLVVLAITAPSPAAAQAKDRSAPVHFGLGVGSLVLTLPYGLAKTAYALGGSLTGGLAWALTGGRWDIARAIIQPAIRGHYVITPQQLTGGQSLVFVGRDPVEGASSAY